MTGSKPFRMSADRARERARDTAHPSMEGPSQIRALRRAIIPYKTAAEYVQEIRTLWAEAAESFLTIGRWLNKAKETLPHGEWQRMIEEQLPFDRNRAYQLRMVATMVDSGRVAETDLPMSSATAYLFTNLDQEGIQAAKQDGILRPDVKRPEVREWKARYLGPRLNSEEIQRRREALLARIKRYEDELDRARQELRALEVEFERTPLTIDGIAHEPAK